MQKSKNVRVVKCTSQELFIAMCNVKNELLNKVVKDKERMSIPVIHLFQLTKGYILQAHNKIKAGKGGGYSQRLKNFPLHDVGHTKASWEAMGITKGRLPTTIISELGCSKLV